MLLNGLRSLGRRLQPKMTSQMVITVFYKPASKFSQCHPCSKLCTNYAQLWGPPCGKHTVGMSGRWAASAENDDVCMTRSSRARQRVEGHDEGVGHGSISQGGDTWRD